MGVFSRKSQSVKNMTEVLIFAVLLTVMTGFIGMDTVEAYSDTDVYYTDGITGGGIYFDKTSGTVTDCDESVTNAVIPDTIDNVQVTVLGATAFENCQKLKTVDISGGVKQLGHRTFKGCTSLETINIDSDNAYFSSIDGVLFDKNNTYIYKYPQNKLGTEYSMPSGTKSSIQGAFSGSNYLQKVVLNEGFETVSIDCFKNCSKLREVSLPAGLVRINEYAFAGCSSLTNVDLPDTVTGISNYLFKDCTSLQTITVGKNIASIANTAFMGCDSLKYINVDENNARYTSENGVLYNKDKTELLRYPSGKTESGFVIPDSVTAIGINAFSRSQNLRLIDIPGSVTEIKSSAFLDCDLLNNVVIPGNVKQIGAYAFSGCDSLTDLTISTGVERIEDGAFEYEPQLQEVILPQGITSIGDRAFSGCGKLKKLVIPSSVTTIGSDILAGSQGAVIYCESGSTAESYATENGISSSKPDQKDDPVITAKKSQTITASNYQKIYGDKAFSLGASARTALTYKCLNTDVADVSGDGTVTIKSAGTAVIEITAAETDEYYKASKEVTVTVSKSEQPEYTGAAEYTKTYGDKNFTVSVPAKTKVSFTSSDSEVAEVISTSGNNAQIYVKSSGTAVVTAKAAEDKNYKSKEYRVTVNVSKAEQKITETDKYSVNYGCVPFKLKVSAKTPASYESLNPDVAEVSENGIVTVKNIGTAVIRINAPETGQYKGASAEVTLKVEKALQTISSPSSITREFRPNGYYSINAKSKTDITYKSSNIDIADVTSTGKIIMKNPGKVTITITAAMTDKYKGAVRKMTFTTVFKKPVLTARSYSGKKIKLTWSQVPGASGYKLYIYDNAKKKYVCRLTKGASVKSVTHKGLKAGRTYKYKVRAYRVVNGKKIYSSYSKVKSVKAKR